MRQILSAIVEGKSSSTTTTTTTKKRKRKKEEAILLLSIWYINDKGIKYGQGSKLPLAWIEIHCN